LIGIIYSLINGKFLQAGILLFSLYLCSFLGGKKAAHLYLQMSFVKFLKHNGGEILYSQAKDYYSKVSKKKVDEEKAQELLSELLSAMVNEGIVNYENEIISLNQNAI
jgi:hypothetical protein